MAQKKQFPRNPSFELQRDLLTRPETNPTNYVPLQDAGLFAFDPSPLRWSRVNAWWLADASWLAYSHNDTEVRRIFREHGGMPSCELIDQEGTECYVAHGDTFAIVAFRGTQPDDWVDLFEISRFIPDSWDVGRVHRGFKSALDVVRPRLENALNGLPRDCKVWFTGHSLGAALATLAATRYADRAAGVYTFASPRVGDEDFTAHVKRLFGSRSIRYVHDHDIVTHVPPPAFAAPGQYAHVDELRWIGSDGEVGRTEPLPHFFPQIFGDARLLRDVIEILLEGKRIAIPDALVDHTPLYYALHAWNDFAANEAPQVAPAGV